MVAAFLIMWPRGCLLDRGWGRPTPSPSQKGGEKEERQLGDTPKPPAGEDPCTSSSSGEARRDTPDPSRMREGRL